MSKPKFKIGDKVKVLPSAVCGGVRSSEVGTIQTVIKIIDLKITDITASRSGSWRVEAHQIEHVVKVGEQLLFSFMD